MLKKEVLAGINKQVQYELSAAHSYLSLAVYFDRELLKGFGQYMRKQSEEERTHAIRLVDYILDRGEKVALSAVEAPKVDFASPLDALKHALEMERANTAAINALYALAGKQDDLATQNALQWFINEQVEEEKWAEEFVGMAEKVAASPGALFMLDHRVSKLVEEGK